VDLCLDLAEVSGQVLTTARVVWSDSSGRVGLSFPRLRDADLKRLQQWLFLNAMAGAANAASLNAPPDAPAHVVAPDYTDTLNAASAVQREAESLESDLETILTLIAWRSMSLLQASGSAIALAEKDGAALTCRARAGISAPPVGAVLQSGSGFSGDCVRTGKIQRCDDTETDSRVDPQTCRALGIRSMLACPISSGEKVIGLIEVFSARPNAFAEKDAAVLQRFAETIATAANRNGSGGDSSPAPPTESFSPPGSVLFASLPEENPKKENRKPQSKENSTLPDRDKIGGIRLPRTHLYLLVAAAAAIALALGFILAPWIQQKVQARVGEESTVLASSQPSAEAAPSSPSIDTANYDQLLKLAQQGNSAAQNALGLLYAEGDDKRSIKQDEGEAAGWFTKAAENGSVPAQYKLGLLYWGGHGVPKDQNKAYFWAVLARAGGQEGSKDLAQILANGMTRTQAAAIERQADLWYQQHEAPAKPPAGH
jgi:hypothetical protein